MEFLTNDKLTIVGAAGMIGSNMAQTALMMRLTPNICLYDPYAPALEGVAEELYHCAFEGVNITWTSDVKEALSGAAYVVSSGGAARKAGMTREDLLKGNAEIAAQFGKDIKAYCPDVKHVVVVFNPADITGLITLIYAGLKPSQVSTLAALDSTRLRSELAKYFKISPDEIRNCRTYGGHGEQMAVFASTTLVAGRPLSELIGREMPEGDWHDLQQRVIQGGKHFIDRHEDLRKAALTDNRCDLVKRVRSVSVKLADSRADQLLHTSVAAQFFADIVAQGADIRSLRTRYLHAHQRKLHFQNADLVKVHRAGLPLDLDAFPRQLVEFLSINLQRGIHRRHLLLLPDKRGDAVPHLFFRHGHRRFCCHGSAHVLRIRCDSKVKQCFIRLRFIGQHIAETRSLSNADRKHARRIRV